MAHSPKKLIPKLRLPTKPPNSFYLYPSGSPCINKRFVNFRNDFSVNQIQNIINLNINISKQIYHKKYFVLV